MQITEIKNNLVKISYDTSMENPVLSGFLVIKDSIQSFIAQIIHLEANSKGNFIIAQLLFTFNDQGVISNYNGSIPDINSILDFVQPQELLELLPAQNPILFGEIAQQNTQLTLDRKILENKLLICCEKEEDNNTLTKNIAKQLVISGKNVLVIDLVGDLKEEFSENVITASENFKLPLNYESINFIYEKGLDEAKPETKALVQEIFLEVQNYVKTLPEKFIPFKTFKNVVDDQYQETEMVELVLLKNKLLKYYEEGVFAQSKKEFNSFQTALEKENLTVFDLSRMDENVQREMISYAYSLISSLDKDFYVFCNLDNLNSDKKLLKQIFTSKKVFSTLVCPYGYKYLKELKQLSRDLILFAPIQQQNDFASYNAFLSKLNPHEFVVYGQATHNLPLIVKLKELSESDLQSQETRQETEQEAIQQQPSSQDLLDEEIKKDVDEIYTAQKTETVPQEDEFSAEVISDELTEDDLDFLDNINLTQETDGTENIETQTEEEIPDFTIQEPEEELIEESEFSETDENQNIKEIEEAEWAEETQTNTEQYAQTFEGVLSQQAGANEGVSEEENTPFLDILPVKAASTPMVPIYPADIEPKVESEQLEQGDVVAHPKYGKGTVEKLITYGSKTLCSINFDNVGRRLLDPTLVEIKKIS